MTKEIMPFKLLEQPKVIKEKYDTCYLAKQLLKKSTKEKFDELMKSSDYNLLVVMLKLIGGIGGLICGICCLTTHSASFFLGSVGGYILITSCLAKILKKKAVKEIDKQLAENDTHTKLELADPLNQKAETISNEIVRFNRQLMEFNALLKRIDDFRPLNEEELAGYELLTKQRRALGAKMLDFEDQLRLPRAVEAVKLLLTEPNVSRFELEKKMDEQRQKLEAETERYRNMQNLHAQLFRPGQ